ncbi:MAG: hypothetical protein ACE149_13680 [Armatimonadota bacterium]
MTWGSLGPAFLVGIGAGMLLARVRSEHTPFLLAACVPLVILVAFCILRALPRRRTLDLEPPPAPRWDPSAAPKLGEMLLRYGLISEENLEKALERQKQSGKRLGQVVVEMELMTHAQVAQVLEEQLSRRENRLLWGRGEALVR